MKKVAILQLILFVSTSIAFAQEKVTNRNGKEITVNVPASTATQGVVKLAGDLGGTADVPTVPALTNKLEGSGTINYIPKFTATKTLGNSLLFENGTNVGLGTITPVSLFEISDASETFTGNGTLRISNSSNPTVNKFAGLVFKSNNVSGVGGSWKIGSNQETITSYEQNFHFLNSYNGSTYASKMTLTPSGNLGVGTTSPGNKLEITQGTAGNSGLRFTNLNSASTATTSSSKVLALNSSGDVILTNVPGTQNIVAFSTATPTTSGVVFTPATPADQSVVYQSSVDNSMWTYNGTSYVTYTAPASTAWYTSSTTNDAGNSKTSNIYRTGNLGIGTNNPTTPLEVQSTLNSLYVSTAKFLAPSNTTPGNSTLLNFGVSATTGNTADWRYVYQGSGVASNRVDFGMGGYAAPMLSYLNSGNVGIGITAPLTKLHIQGVLATQTINADAQMLRFSRAPQSNIKWDNIAQFNLGSYVGSPTITAKTRLDLAMNDGDGVATSNVMTWQANGNVGINTTAPSAPLVIQGLSGQGSLKFTAPVVNASGDNWWMGFGHGTTSTDANDRARIGAEIISGGSGRLFFTTGAAGAQTRAMFIDESQRVGIGTSTPTGQLEVATTNGLSAIVRRASNQSYTSANLILQRSYSTDPAVSTAVPTGDYIGRILFSASNGTSSYPSNGPDIVGFAYGTQTANTNGGGMIFRTVKDATNSVIERMKIDHNGNIGIGTSAPVSKLEVNGAATNTTAFNAAAGTSIDFSKSNLAYTTASPSAFTLTNLKDGGTYTLAVQGTTAGTASFSGSNPSNTAFSFSSINNGPTIAGKQTLYTFIVMGTTVYFYMASGF